MTNKKDIEFESDNVKTYVQQIQAVNGILAQQLDQLKAEVKSKTEYIQEQRDIINQYSKEIEMYKKCQGKRASKREEELKADNKYINDLLNQALKDYDKAIQTLTEIKEIAQYDVYTSRTDLCLKLNWVKKKISEVENV